MVDGMDATIFAALGEPSRLDLIEVLRRGRCAVGELVERLGIRQPQVSKHLRVLREAGLVDVEPDGRRRIYRLREEPFLEIDDWVGSFEALWETRLGSLEAFLDTTDDSNDD